MKNKHNKIEVVKLGNKTQWAAAYNILSKNFKNVRRYSDDLQIISGNSMCFILRDGIVVNWQNDEAFKFIIKQKKHLFSNLIKSDIHDIFYFEKKKKFDIKNDVIVVPEIEPKILVSISYVLARSVQLDYCEKSIHDALAETAHIPGILARIGKIKMSTKKINKIIGKISGIKFNINLNSLKEDKPMIFWEKPELITYYEKVTHYMEISDRIQVMNEKMSALYNILDVLRDEHNNKHAANLEIIIIILIVIEVVIYVYELFI